MPRGVEDSILDEAQFFGMLLRAWFVLAALVFIALFLITAPYGRHTRRGWGPQIGARAGWIIMESISAVSMAGFFLLGDRPANPVAIVFLIMWEAHYLHRSFIFPFRMRVNGKRMPVLIVGMGMVFNLGNCYLNGRYLFHFGPVQASSWLMSPQFLMGTFIFLSGFAINYHSDHILLNLRKPGETGYRIPRGGLYRWVSSPNYLGEILEWSGWAIATWSIPGLCFAVWTFANLAPRAWSHHQWYREQFPDYPPERKALIPGLL
jgi:protein-S-isoprenylcysteine O-methyltransferase Ste14